MNIHKVHKSHPEIFTQLTLKDQLFCYYKCPQKDKILRLYTDHNQLTFAISGGRIFRIGDDSWLMGKDRGVLVKRGVFLQAEIPGIIRYQPRKMAYDQSTQESRLTA